jgi:poly(3-hydroxybutyrate) depolymerase
VVGEKKRCYYTYIPECADGETPVVYDIHGYNVCPRHGRSLHTPDGSKGQAEECVIVVWPTVSNAWLKPIHDIH